MTQTAKRGDLIRDAALGITLAISSGSAAMTVIDRTTGSAKSAEQLEGRLVAAENRINANEAERVEWRKLIAASAARASFLCVRDAACDKYLGRMKEE